MELYRCKVRSCEHNNTLTTDRKFIFNHYIKHLRRDLDNTVIELKIIEKPYRENKFSLINSLINSSNTKDLKF